MKRNALLPHLGFAFSGLLFCLLAFALFTGLNFHQPLRSLPDEEKLHKAAMEYLRNQGLVSDSLRFNRTQKLNNPVHRFMQVYHPDQMPEIAPELVRLTYSYLNIGEIVVNEDLSGAEVTLNGTGELRGFSLHDIGKNDSIRISESEARTKAEDFLKSQGLRLEDLSGQSSMRNEEDGILTFTFTYEAPAPLSDSLVSRYSVSTAGSMLSRYDVKLELNEKRFKYPEASENVNNTLEIGALVAWALVSVLLLIIFLRRLRHDELEFRNALWVGIASGVIIAVAVGIKAYPSWTGVLLGGGISGLLGGLGLVLVYATVESLLRERWPEKLREIDLLQLRRFRVREIGAGILRAIGFTGIVVFCYTIAMLVTEKFGLGYIKIDNENLHWISDWWGLLPSLPGNATTALWIATSLLLFPFTFIFGRFKRPLVASILLVIFLEFAGLHGFFVRPNVLAAALTLPAAIALAVMTYRSNALSVYVSLFLLLTARDLFNCIGGSSDLLLQMGIYLAVMIVLGALAVIALTGKAVAEDFEDYVPEYVSRIAERERIKNELEIARNIQFKFLPQEVPDYPGLEIACLCKPAMEVGGDYYDFIPENDHLRVLVGDVSGKGVSAAFYMTMTKGIIKTLSRQVQDPALILTETNQIFYENSPRNVFISLLYGDFDLKQRQLTFARAGHNPLLVHQSQDRRSFLMNPGGIAIGMDGGEVFRSTIHQETVPFTSGDIFVFYTDGVSEAMNPAGEEFGEPRLEKLINENSHLSAEKLLDLTHDTITEFCGHAPQHDDFTMVIIKIE